MSFTKQRGGAFSTSVSSECTGDSSSTGTVSGVPLFIQDDAPVTTATQYLWIQTGLNGNPCDMTFWVETGED